MANTKKEQTNTESTVAAKKTTARAAKPETTQPESGPSYQELMDIVKALANEVQTLKAGANTVQAQQPVDKTEQLINLLASRKSDKEVVIVHNCELLGGLTTHMELLGMNIDFRTIGEQRVLSWQQFEQCVSKYRNFFDRQVILLDDPELAARYNVPCVKRGKSHVITHEDIVKLHKMDIRELEDFINSLTDSDKDFVFSYWLGKCYTREKGFYDRYKVETLNRLSGKRVFDNIIVLMNGDYNKTED